MRGSRAERRAAADRVDRRHRSRRALVGLAALVVVVFLGLCGAAWLASPTPSALDRRIATYLRGTGGRTLRLGQIPLILRRAVVATEDERFYSHHGIDVIGVLRALPYDVTHLSFAQGASTITEQLAKVLYLGGNDHNPWRKLEDGAVAWKLENRYTKATILAAYLNSAYFGDDAYGVRAAAKRYFATSARRLNPAQATLLAGLIQAPSLYNPLDNPQLARARQVQVLRSLVRSGYLTETSASAVLAQPLQLRDGKSLAPVLGINLSPGPAFIWWQLALGTTLILLGGLALATGRRHPGNGWTRLTLTIVFLALVIAGLGTVVRSFRTA